jgi:FdhD protein
MEAGAQTVEETQWWLDANGRRVAGGTMTPERARELGAGRLVADGYVETAADLTSLNVAVSPAGVVHISATVSARRCAAAEAESLHRRTSGCGLHHFLRCDPDSIRRPRRVPPAETAQLAERLKELFEAASHASAVGGVHAAALSDGASLLDPVIDIGRHNTVDKAIGAALLEDRDLSGLGLIVTARLSAEMTLKAARAGIAWVASRSIATTLAVALATVAGLPLIGRAASREPLRYDPHVRGVHP